MIVYISGIPGAGKSTVGKDLAKALGWQFCDIDDYVTDTLKAVVKEKGILPEQEYSHLVEDIFLPKIAMLAEKGEVVVAGILLRENYVTKLRETVGSVTHLFLDVPYEILVDRVSNRSHFAGVSTVDLCWDAVDSFYTGGIHIDASKDPEEVVEFCVRAVKTPRDI